LSATATPDDRLLLRREEAARRLSMSLDSFERHVQPHLRLVRVGSLVRVPVWELERWVERQAARTVGDG
jgi:excisionase family DNA binding protein